MSLFFKLSNFKTRIIRKREPSDTFKEMQSRLNQQVQASYFARARGKTTLTTPKPQQSRITPWEQETFKQNLALISARTHRLAVNYYAERGWTQTYSQARAQPGTARAMLELMRRHRGTQRPMRHSRAWEIER